MPHVLLLLRPLKLLPQLQAQHAQQGLQSALVHGNQDIHVQAQSLPTPLLALAPLAIRAVSVPGKLARHVSHTWVDVI